MGSLVLFLPVCVFLSEGQGTIEQLCFHDPSGRGSRNSMTPGRSDIRVVVSSPPRPSLGSAPVSASGRPAGPPFYVLCVLLDRFTLVHDGLEAAYCLALATL